MSGIAALIGFDGPHPQLPDIAAMTDAMRHRGPDGIRHRMAGMAAFGHCMLRTTAESLEEEQPLANADGSLVMVMDGRVDNAPELRHALRQRGCRLRDGSDAELVLHAYETWREGCLAHIDGDFALLVWDAGRQCVFGARDRIGIKPFHYHWAAGRLAVASEMAGLLRAPGIVREYNLGAIAEYLADTPIGCDETLFRNCMRLPAGHFLVANAGGIRLERYWHPERVEPLLLPRYEDYAERLAELLAHATARRLRSHRPIGTLLSGGIDSSTIACFANASLAGGAQDPLHTYSLVYPGLSCDEQQAIEQFLQRLGIPPGHRHLFDGTAPNLAGLEASLARPELPDSPIGAAYYPLYADAASRGCRVMLGGWGADDWLGGGTGRLTDQIKYGGIGATLGWLRLQRRTHGTGGSLRRWLRFGVRPRLGRLLRRSRWLAATRAARAGVSPLLSPELAGLLRQRRIAKLQAQTAESGSYRHAQALAWLRSGMFANNTVLQEAGCALHGIEGRYPFHDRAILEFALALPAQALAGETRYKQLLHAALASRSRAVQGHAFGAPEGSPIYAAAAFAPHFARMPLAELEAKGWIDRNAACAYRQRVSMSHAKCDDDQVAFEVRNLWQLLALERWLQLNAMPTGGPS